jgi:hypothetical protein
MCHVILPQFIDDKWILINKIKNRKDNCLFHICMLKLNEGHMNAIHVEMINQQDLIIWCFHYYELQFIGYLDI